MKTILLTLTLLVSLYSTATVKTSIIDGDWSSPETWSPASVPLSEDTVIINTNVYVDDIVGASINTFIINSGFTLEGDNIFGLSGNLFNYGTIDIRILAISGGTLTRNEGTIQGDRLTTGNNLNENIGNIESDSLVVGNTLFQNSGSIDNISVILSGNAENTGLINTTTLITSEELTNNGDITVQDWTHGDGTVTGVTGKFCVSGCFLNAASITGTLDICDESLGGFCDINTGDIAATVTLCEASPCGVLSLPESETVDMFKVYPNPTSNFLNVITPNTIGTVFEVAIYSIDGSLLYEQKNITNGSVEIDVTSVLPGTYICVMSGSNFIDQEIISIR